MAASRILCRLLGLAILAFPALLAKDNPRWLVVSSCLWGLPFLPLILAVPLPRAIRAVPPFIYATFMVPMLPLVVSLSVNIPLDLFHRLGEESILTTRTLDIVTPATVLTLVSQVVLLPLAVIPVDLVLRSTLALVRDACHIYTGHSGVDMPFTSHLLSVLTRGAPASFVTLALGTSMVWVVSVLGPVVLMLAGAEEYKSGILYSMVLSACAQAAYVLLNIEIEGRSAAAELQRFIPVVKGIPVAVAAAFAIAEARHEALQGMPWAAARHSVSYLLGCGTSIGISQLFVFFILRTVAWFMTSYDMQVKRSHNYLAFRALAALVGGILLTSITGSPRVVWVIGVLFVVQEVALLFLHRSVGKQKGMFISTFLVTAICLVCSSEVSLLARLGVVGIMTSLPVAFIDGFAGQAHRLLLLGPQCPPERKPPVFRDWLESFLSWLRTPLWLGVALAISLAVGATIQEGPLNKNNNDGYFDASTFTDLLSPVFDDRSPDALPVCAPTATRSNGLPTYNSDCYAVCAKRWEGLDILDLSLAASMAYVNVTKRGPGRTILDELNHPKSRGHLDGVGDWTIRHNENSKRHWVAFLDLYSPSRNISVIAVRGTSPLRCIDWFVDVSMFGEVTIFSFLSRFIPGLSFWPSGLFQSFLLVYSDFVDAAVGDMEHTFYAPVVAYAERSLAKSPRKVVFVGHSLGGAVAKIAGTMVGWPAVGISSPGILDSRRKFKYHGRYVRSYEIRRLVTNIYSEGDYVPAVGKLGGIVTELYCSDGAKCHSLPGTVCELYRKCPSGATGRELLGSRRRLQC